MSGREIVDRFVDSWNQRDIDAMLSVLAADLDYRVTMPSNHPQYGQHEGQTKEAFYEYLQRAAEEVEQIAFEVHDVLESDSRVAFVGHEAYRLRSIGRGSAHDFVWVFEISDGKITKFREYFDTFKAGSDYAG